MLNNKNPGVLPGFYLRLNEEISELVEENPSNSFSLIEAATRLSRPGSLPVNKLSKLAKSLEKNNFGFKVFQSLDRTCS